MRRPGPFTKTAVAWDLLLAAVILVGAVGPQSARAQGSFPGSGTDRNVNLRVYPFDTWGPRVGPGIGAGLVVHNLGRRHARWLLTAAPARHEQVATLSFASADPNRARQYVVVSFRGLHTDRRWFYGLGPSSSDAERLSFRQQTGHARIGVGQSFLEGRVRVRPQLTMQHVRTTGLTGDPSLLSPPSQRHVDQLRGGGSPGAQQTGVRVGTMVHFATLPPADAGRSGLRVQGEWERYVDLGGASLAFDQLDLMAHGSLLITLQQQLHVRVGLVRTWSRDTTPVPFYQRPTLDGSIVPGWARSRFVGNDRITASARYEFPLVDASPLLTLNGHVGVHAAGIYNDLPSQFTPTLSFDQTLGPDRSTYPLRPSASVGLKLNVPMRPRTTVDFALGVSPEGVSALRLQVDHPLSLFRMPHHTSRSVR